MAQPDFVTPGAAAPPGRLGRFLLGRELGRGATGVVYAATDARLGLPVALKVLTLPPHLSADRRRDLAERFAREARAVSQLSHPAIVTLTEFGQAEDGRQFLVMERLTGETLRARLQRGGPLLASEALPLLTQIADALQYAHGRGIVHRDVKPDNIFVCADGTAKLMDFGVARVYAEDGPTRAGTVVGSPAYMSPEQIGGGALDGRSDVFSLAVTLAEALTGRRPFEGADIPSVMHQILHRPPELGGVGLRPLRRALERALAKNPAARTPSAGALAGALRQAAPAAFAPAGDVAATLTTMVMPRWAIVPPRPNYAARWGVAGGLGALALTGLSLLALHHRAPAPSAPPAVAPRVASLPRGGREQAPAATTPPDGGEWHIIETTPPPAPVKPTRPDAGVLQSLRDGTGAPPPMPPPFPASPVTKPAPRARPKARPTAARPSAAAFDAAPPSEAAPAGASSPDTVPADAVLYGMGNVDRVQAPHLIHHTDPIYPPSAASAAGTARLLVSVNTAGGVADARVVRSSGDSALDTAAIATVLHWQYAPATHDGHAVAANVAETVTFGPH